MDWPDGVDETLSGDQVVALALTTPARGAVVHPLTNTGLRDRGRGAVAPVTTSIGMWRKLERIQRDPRVAVAFHTRHLAFHDRPEYVLVQGRAAHSALPDGGWIERHRDEWERFSGPRDVGLAWERWLRVYHHRVGIDIAVERLVVWPDLACAGVPDVYGAAPPGEPAPQSPPAKGTGPRVDHRRAARRAARLPNALLGWVGADGLPVVAPVEVAGAGEHGIRLEAPPGLVPAGGRRAALLAHSFARYTFGQHQRKHTGWLECSADTGALVYAPHTESGYRLPESRRLYWLAAGFVTRRGLRAARRAGFL